MSAKNGNNNRGVPQLLDRLCGKLVTIPLDSIESGKKELWYSDIVALDRICTALAEATNDPCFFECFDFCFSTLNHIKSIGDNHALTLKEHGVEPLLKRTLKTFEEQVY